MSEHDTARTNGRSVSTDLPEEVLNNPTRRRSWLLSKALESLPFDRALELARSAEAFITGSAAGSGDDAPPSERQPSGGENKPQKRTGLVLSPDQREQLLERLAQGATNAELASEFDLSARQAQGIRMGSAREIASRRSRSPQKS
jgi:hypothetical protein